MKLIIKEIKGSRNPRLRKISETVLLEGSFEIKLGIIPFKGVIEDYNYDDLFEIIDDKEVTIKVKSINNTLIKVKENEISNYSPRVRKDGLTYYRYEFSLSL